ncbi:MAG: DMT family transporter, partial [Clostridia bacterium]|nr:DMT family transporter [Clostridia bacterium]
MAGSTDKGQRNGMLLLGLCTLLWSMSGVFIKTIPWHALVLAGSRGLIAGCVMALYFKFRCLRLVLNRTSLSAAVMLGATFLTFVSATKMTTAANAIVIQASSPVFVLLYNGFARKQRVVRRDVIAVLITLLGVSLFFLEQIGGGYFLGNLLALVSGVTLAATYVITCGAKEEERMSGILLSHLFTAAVGLPFALFN